jgi:AraC family transcriptional regulator of adaptative response/methylated-DNA-[protein]-cysteine methyltransferase
MPLRGEMIAAFLSRDGSYDAFRRFMGNAPTALTDARVVTVTRITTPLGPMVAGSVDDALCLLEFADRRMTETQIARLQKRLECVFVPGNGALFGELTGELEAYFRSGLTDFSVPLRTPGTDF